MQRYFIPFDANDEIITITGNDFHHIKNVMRMKVGDIFYVSNNETVYYAEIIEFLIDSVRCRLIEEVKDTNELPVRVAIAQGIPKSDKLEFVIQKTTELGVHEIIPVKSERSIVKIDAKKAVKRKERYEKIAKEASEQCHRTKIPQINDFMTIKELIEYSRSFTHCFVAYEASSEADKSRFALLFHELKPTDSVLFYVGPEGGISDQELSSLKDAGFQVISLGNRILRTETAPIMIMSSFVYELEVKGRS